MATQNNNVILLEKDASSPLRGAQRTVDAADDIVLAPATVAIQPTGNVSINSTSGTLSMGNAASTQAINVGTNGARIITIGQGVGIGPTIVLNGTTNTTIIEGVGALSVGSAYSGTETVNIASASSGALGFIRTLNIGSTTGASSTNMYSGSGGTNIFGLTAIASTTSTIALTSTSGAITIDGTTTGTIGIGTNGGTGSISIGTAATNRQIIIGNATNTSVFRIDAGSGGIAISTNATAGVINLGADNGTGTIQIGTGSGTRAIDMGTGAANGTISIGTAAGAGRSIIIGNSTGTSSLSLQAGTGALDIGTAATNKAITIGQTANTSTLSIRSGQGGISISVGSTAGNIALGGTSTGQITLGQDAGTGTISIGSSTGARQIDIGNGATSTATVNIVGAGATGARSVNVATGGTAAKTLTMGSTASTSATTIQTGTGAMTFTAGGIYDVNATGVVTIDSSTAGINIGADTVNQAINIGINGNRAISIGAFTNTGNVDLRAGYRGVLLGIGSVQGARGIGYFGFNRSGSAYTDGALLAYKVSPTADNAQPQYVLASAANGAAASIKWVVAVSCQNASVANDGQGNVCTVAGTITPVQFAAGAAPAGPADIGKPVYLSATVGQSGKATLTAPSGSGERVWQVGLLARGVADANSNWFVQLMPQFIADIP
jgi:hypothetical protein